MDYSYLAQKLFPNVNKTIADLELQFPSRSQNEDAKITRLGPSPTGFIHLGNLYGAFVDERLAHQSGGKMLLRIEDTDAKRKVEGATEIIIKSLAYFGINFDEGCMMDHEEGNYGPYYQSLRSEIYHIVAKHLVSIGRAYPSFATEQELEEIRLTQQRMHVLPGYYGSFATDRLLTIEQIEENLNNNKPWVLRLLSQGDNSQTILVEDAIRGEVVTHPNNQDIVLLKSDGIPTYHFAHVCDDHFMRITHVVRGEEWLSTLPIHLELFELLGWKHPIYCHTAHLMKIDNGIKRKLSKRKDPELSLEFYMELGYFPEAVLEYLMTILNSDFEEWRQQNPDANLNDFEFTLNKMSTSGALFDMDKLNDISKEVVFKLTPQRIYEFLLEWAKKYQPQTYELYVNHEKELLALIDIGRHDTKPRKDLVYGQQIAELMSYYFDETYQIKDQLPARVTKEMALNLLSDYVASYTDPEDNATWFEMVKMIGEKYNYTSNMKAFKKEPANYLGNVADVASVIRLAIAGQLTSPDLFSIQKIMQKERVLKRINNFMAYLEKGEE